MGELYILLGGNIGDTRNVFSQARQLLQDRIGRIGKQSSLYASPPWGFDADSDFLNQVLSIHTVMLPEDALAICLGIEIELGRDRSIVSETYSSRLIDIDLLYYGDLVIDSEVLSLPHPHIGKRRFTLLPLEEIAPDFEHPIARKSNRELLSLCGDSSVVLKQES